MTESSSIAMPNMNWVTLLEHHADRYPDKVFAELEGQSITYAELLANVRRLSAG